MVDVLTVRNEYRLQSWMEIIRKCQLLWPSAIIYTLVESAKANGLEPYLYLRCLLEELRFFERTLSAADLEAFMPWSPTIPPLIDKYK